MPGSRLLRRIGRRIAAAVAHSVDKNELFEQPGERPQQPPLYREPSPQPAPSPEPAAPATTVAGCDVGGIDAVQVILGPTGAVRVINHWATWCDPCVEELPLLASLHQKLSKQADFHGISWDLFEGGRPRAVAEKVAAFAREHGIAYPSLLVDADPGAFFSALELDFQKIPQTWVISAGGDILHRVEGIVDEAAAEEIVRVVSAQQS